MKKAFIALAVLSAASGAALAQSSVTLYGNADIAIGKAPSTGDQKWGLQSSTIVTSNGRSRFGLIGKEDLGGGLWAGFNYEGDVNLDTGAGDGFARAAWVGLGSSAWGSVKLGNQYTTGWDGLITYELTHLAQYSVLTDTFGFGGNGNPFLGAQIKYQTPVFYGLNAEISYVPKADGALIDNGVSNRSDRWSMSLTYAQGPLHAALLADKPSHTQTGGGNANRTNWSLGGSYAFGSMFALSASYNQTNNAMHWRGDPGLIYGARRYGWELGGSFFTGPFTITLDLTRDTKNDLYGGKKYTNGVLEGKYNLSKRTYLYADWLRLDGDNNYGIGIDHSF
jgi:predicted porin